mgnify:FL=1
MKAIGCDAVLIGHCEERRDKLSIMLKARVQMQQLSTGS